MDTISELQVDKTVTPSPVLPALIWAEGIDPPHPTVEIPAFLAEVLATAREAGETFVPEPLRKRVRGMLRHGKYKPSGRSKPASEFLLRAALANTFPLVNPPVDVNNAVSLASGLPGSIFDADLTGRDLLLRRGRPGETYIFNPTGQVIDLEDLLVVCRRDGEAWTPCGNPVKDAMATKIRSETRRVVAVLYAPADEPPAAVERWASRFADLLGTHCAANDAGYRVIEP